MATVQSEAAAANPTKAWGEDNKHWNLFIARFFECPFCIEGNNARGGGERDLRRLLPGALRARSVSVPPVRLLAAGCHCPCYVALLIGGQSSLHAGLHLP